MTVANSFGSRADRAEQLAASGGITRSADGTAWLVPSRTEAGRFYSVIKVNGEPRCNCTDFLTRGRACQHVLAAGIVAKRSLAFGEKLGLENAK